jgi:hypothetical protein
MLSTERPQLLSVEYQAAQPIRHAGLRIVPFVRLVRLRAPLSGAVLHWTKPTSVLVTHPDGAEQILPVPDPTRRFVLFMALTTLTTWLIFRSLSKRRN